MRAGPKLREAVRAAVPLCPRTPTQLPMRSYDSFPRQLRGKTHQCGGRHSTDYSPRTWQWSPYRRLAVYCTRSSSPAAWK